MQLKTLDECFDLSFTEEPANYFYLMLELYPHEARAMWYHTTKKMVTGFASYPFNGSLSALLQNHKRLGLAYKEVLLSIRSSNYLLYPNILGSSIDEEAFKLTNNLSDDERLQQFPLVNLKAQVIYTVRNTLDKESHIQLAHFKMLPHVAPAIEMEVNYLKKQGFEDAIWAYTYGDQLDLRVYQDGKLKLANSFFQSGKEDIAYFILYASEILKVDTKAVKLYLGGDVSKADNTWNLLSDYWQCLVTTDELDNVSFSSMLPPEKIRPYQHLTFSLLCAS